MSKIQIHNKFEIISGGEVHTAFNVVLNNLARTAKQNPYFSDYLLIGEDNGSMFPGEITLNNGFLGKAAAICAYNFDPTKGKCFISREIELTPEEVGGKLIGEIGFSYHIFGTGQIVNRAVFEPRIEIKEKSILRGTLYLEAQSDGYVNFCGGENMLIKCLLGADNIYNYSFCMASGTAVFPGDFVLTENCDENAYLNIAPASARYLADNTLSFTYTAKAGDIRDIVVLMEEKPVLRAYAKDDFFSMGFEHIVISGGCIADTRMDGLTNIHSISISTVPIDESKYYKFSAPTKIYPSQFPIYNGKFEAKATRKYSDTGNYIIYKGEELNIYYLGEENRIVNLNTVNLPLDKDFKIDSIGNVYHLADDQSTVIIYKLKEGKYQKAENLHTFAEKINTYDVSVNRAGEVFVCTGTFTTNTVTNYKFSSNYEFVSKGYSKVYSSLKAVFSNAEGYFMVRNSGIYFISFTAQMPYYNIYFVDYTSTDTVECMGQLAINKKLNGKTGYHTYNHANFANGFSDLNENSSCSPQVLMQKKPDNVLFIRILYEMALNYNLNLEDRDYDISHTIMTKNFFVSLDSDGAIKSSFLFDKTRTCVVMRENLTGTALIDFDRRSFNYSKSSEHKISLYLQ